MSANQDLHTSPHTYSDRLTSEDPSVNPYEHNLSQSDTRQRTLDCPKHATVDPISSVPIACVGLDHYSHLESSSLQHQSSSFQSLHSAPQSTNAYPLDLQDSALPESQQSLTLTEVHQDFLQIASCQEANPSSTKPSTESHPSPESPSTHSVSEETSSDLPALPTDLVQLGVELHSKLPSLLQQLVSPTFVEPFSDLSCLIFPYRPFYTSSEFRRLWKEEYNQYVKSKPKGSLPSLFDLEMMASSNVEPTEPSADPAWVRSRLQAYGLVQGDDAALKRHPEVLKAAMAVINKPRDSFPNTNDVEMFQAKLKTYENSNEDTLLLQILPFYIREARWVPASSSGPLEPAIFRYVLIEQPADSPQSNKSDVEKVAEQASLTESEDRVSVSFFKSGILEFANRNFSQPIPFFNDETVKLDRNVNKAMEKDAKMTYPRPDRTFGVNPMKITWPSGFTMPRELQLLMEVVRSCYYIFLIVEGKSSGGNISVARNQACRGGAISIHMERSLRVKLDMPEKPGADLTTMVFSVVITDQVVEIWIHWAEVHGPNPKDLSEPLQRPTYHMHCVFVEVLQKVGPIRRAIHNILDWGVGERFQQRASLHKAIIAYTEDNDLTTDHQDRSQKIH